MGIAGATSGATGNTSWMDSWVSGKTGGVSLSGLDGTSRSGGTGSGGCIIGLSRDPRQSVEEQRSKFWRAQARRFASSFCWLPWHSRSRGSSLELR